MQVSTPPPEYPGRMLPVQGTTGWAFLIGRSGRRWGSDVLGPGHTERARRSPSRIQVGSREHPGGECKRGLCCFGPCPPEAWPSKRCLEVESVSSRGRRADVPSPTRGNREASDEFWGVLNAERHSGSSVVSHGSSWVAPPAARGSVLFLGPLTRAAVARWV